MFKPCRGLRPEYHFPEPDFSHKNLGKVASRAFGNILFPVPTQSLHLGLAFSRLVSDREKSLLFNQYSCVLNKIDQTRITNSKSRFWMCKLEYQTTIRPSIQPRIMAEYQVFSNIEARSSYLPKFDWLASDLQNGLVFIYLTRYISLWYFISEAFTAKFKVFKIWTLHCSKQKA